MADYTIKAHDRLPSIAATLSASGAPLNLTGATVKFIMRAKPAGNGATPSAKVNAAAVVVDAANGLVRYDWLAVDTDTPGSFQAEWQITWSDGKKQTVPTLTYHTVDVLADLDDA